MNKKLRQTYEKLTETARHANRQTPVKLTDVQQTDRQTLEKLRQTYAQKLTNTDT